MNFGWGPESYAVTYDNRNVESAYTSTPLGTSNGNTRYALQSSIATMNWRLTTSNSFSFADAMSAFTNQDPADYKHDPMNMSPEPYQSTTPSTISRHDSAQASSATPKTSPNEASATPRTTPNDTIEIADDDDDCEEQEEPPLPLESETTTRARYAANQRHAKARNAQQTSNNTSSSYTGIATTQATAKKAVLREKNKVAAAKCRQRQRKQAETIRAKGSRFSETNAQLKSYVQELRGELNGLRAVALGHGECNDALARYNQVQAERVMREYYSACGGLAGSMMGGGGGGREQAEPQ